MQACMSVKNNCPYPVSVAADGEIFFSDVMPRSAAFCKQIDFGSRRISVINNRGKCIFDLWLSIAPGKRSTLEVNENFCRII